MALPGVDRDRVYLVDAGKAATIAFPPGDYRVIGARLAGSVLPAGVKIDDVTVEDGREGEDELMRLVREVNEDPGPDLKVTVKASVQLPIALDRIVVSFNYEEK